MTAEGVGEQDSLHPEVIQRHASVVKIQENLIAVHCDVHNLKKKKEEMAWNSRFPAMTHCWEGKKPGKAIRDEDPIQEDD